MGRILNKAGHSVIFSDDGEEVVRVMAASRGVAKSGLPPFSSVDVVLMDRNMPNLDGPEAAR